MSALPALADYPQNIQVAAHFREFLQGYRPGAEAVETKFPVTDGTRSVVPGSVGISDGFNKVLIMVGICLICDRLETWLRINIVSL